MRTNISQAFDRDARQGDSQACAVMGMMMCCMMMCRMTNASPGRAS